MVLIANRDSKSSSSVCRISSTGTLHPCLRLKIYTKKFNVTLLARSHQASSKTTMRAESITKRLRRALTFTDNPLVLMVLSVLLTIALRLLSDFGYVWWIRPIGTLFVFQIGRALYLFRKHYQRVFGVSE